MDDSEKYIRKFIRESTKKHSQTRGYKGSGEMIIEDKEPSIVLSPGDMVSTFEKEPEIYLELKNYRSHILSAAGSLDDALAVCKIDGARVRLIPEMPMPVGEHRARIEFTDDLGKTGVFQWSFIIEEESTKFNHYFGAPHGHTSYSDGRGTPLEAHEHVRGLGLHFCITADHSNQLDGVTEGNYEYDPELNEYLEVPGSGWNKTRLEVEEINRRYTDFLALRAFEMSSSLWGHINVIGSSTYVEAKIQMSRLEDFINWLKKKSDIAVVINHPHKHFKYIPYDREMDGIINLIEVANGAPPRKYRRMEEYYFKMLDMGWHLGAVNGQDNHRANWGERDNLTVIMAEGLNTTVFIEALNRRRTYSTETRSLKLTFKANGHFMGSIIEAQRGSKVFFEITAEDESVPIKKLQIITNGGRVIGEGRFNNASRIEWYPETEAAEGEKWYVVKVIHSDGRWGTSSPIFIRGTSTVTSDK